MPVRVYSSGEGFEDNWIEVVDAWTRAETTAYGTLSADAFADLWQRKVDNCHLVTADGSLIDDPTQVFARMNEFDERLIGLIRMGPVTAIRHLRILGELSVRLSSNGTDVAVRTS